MNKAQVKLGLTLLGIIAIVALSGLMLLVAKSPSGHVSYVYTTQKPTVLVSGPLNWDNLFALANSLEAAESWCPYNSIKDGGFLDVLQKTGDEPFNCYVVPVESVPEEYRFKYSGITRDYPNVPPVACFLGSGLKRPEGETYPLICNPTAYFPYQYQ